jgi:hypothetical protein
MKTIECPYFKLCNAPICPLDENKENTIWFSDEAICKNRIFSETEFIKTQKKIAKFNKKNIVKGYFTFNMLNQNIIVRSGFRGLNEDTTIDSSILIEEKWLKNHKPISKTVIDARRSNIKKAREVLEV